MPDGTQGNEGAVTEAVSVGIYDQTYHLRGSDGVYIQELAAVVDGKMRAVAAHGGTVDSLRVAVLAALNIADELAQLKHRYAELAGSQRVARSRAGSLSHLLDEAMDDAADGGSAGERRVG